MASLTEKLPPATFRLVLSLGLLVLAGIHLANQISDRKSSVADHSRAVSESAMIAARLDELEAHESTLPEDSEAYARLQERGVLDAAPQPDWRTKLTEITRKLRLPPPQVVISAQEEADRLPGRDAIRLMRSSMKLDLVLLHEQDLLDILATLAATQGSLMSPRRCRVARDAEQLPSPFTLSAHCELDWLTLSRQDAREHP